MSYLKCGFHSCCQIPRDFLTGTSLGYGNIGHGTVGEDAQKSMGFSWREESALLMAHLSTGSLRQRLNSSVLLEGVGWGLSIYERKYAIFCVHSSLSSLGSHLFPCFSPPPLVALVTYIGTYICIRIFPTYREKEFAGSRSFFYRGKIWQSIYV